MEIKGNKITFTIDEKSIDSFRLSMNVLSKNPDEAFEEWIHFLNNEALRSLGGISKSSASVSGKVERSYLSEKLNNNIVQSRIQRWARNKDGFAYKIIKIFFEFYDSNSNHIVKRERMKQRYYDEYAPGRDKTASDIFTITFRQMCSDAARAYGLIFKYVNDNG